MKIKLTKIQFDYLDNNLLSEPKGLKLKLKITDYGISSIIEVDDETADEIRDWANEELQKKGFDSNYELTDEGKILEQLVDAFFIG